MTFAQSIAGWTEKAPLTRKLVLIIFGSLLLAASSWIEVPMVPVPMTMQTFALLVIGAAYGSRLAFATCAVYLLEGAFGLPVFAGGAAGAQHLIGPTGGYLAAYPFTAAFVGFMVERGFAKNLFMMFAVMLASTVILFASGVGWLATFVGFEKAIAGGLMPFIIGDLVKCALAAAVVQLDLRRK